MIMIQWIKIIKTTLAVAILLGISISFIYLDNTDYIYCQDSDSVTIQFEAAGRLYHVTRIPGHITTPEGDVIPKGWGFKIDLLNKGGVFQTVDNINLESSDHKLALNLYLNNQRKLVAHRYIS